jgi:hypothetical protein
LDSKFSFYFIVVKNKINLGRYSILIDQIYLFETNFVLRAEIKYVFSKGCNILTCLLDIKVHLINDNKFNNQFIHEDYHKFITISSKSSI